MGYVAKHPEMMVRRTPMTMTSGGNHYLEGSLFIDCQGSEMYIEPLAMNRTAWRNKVAILVIYTIHCRPTIVLTGSILNMMMTMMIAKRIVRSKFGVNFFLEIRLCVLLLLAGIPAEGK